MARLYRIRPNHLVLLCACCLRESVAAVVEPNWIVSRDRRWTHNDHRSRSNAEGACQ